MDNKEKQRTIQQTARIETGLLNFLKSDCLKVISFTGAFSINMPVPALPQETSQKPQRQGLTYQGPLEVRKKSCGIYWVQLGSLCKKIPFTTRGNNWEVMTDAVGGRRIQYHPEEVEDLQLSMRVEYQ